MKKNVFYLLLISIASISIFTCETASTSTKTSALDLVANGLRNSLIYESNINAQTNVTKVTH